MGEVKHHIVFLEEIVGLLELQEGAFVIASLGERARVRLVQLLLEFGANLDQRSRAIRLPSFIR